MPSPFELASAVIPVAEGRFTARIPPGWDQGRAAFGGLVLGLLARAMEKSEPDSSRTLRTLLGDICGPVMPGEVQLETRTLRRGNNQSNLEAHLVQSGAVLAVGSSVLATPRKAQLPDFAVETPPAPPDWNSVPVAPIRAPQGPAFGQHVEFRPLRGLPFSGAPTPDVATFIRLRGQSRPLDSADLIALLDAPWPGVFSMATGPRASATISFAGQIFCEPKSLDWTRPLFYRSRIAARHQGHFLELRELWNGPECVAMNQQTLALLK
jgi:hypothetical protein